MNKIKLFIENFLVYGMGGIINKIFPLIMVPIITRIMPNSTYFGISDMSNTIVSFASALAIMGMYDAMYRMFFEEDDEEYKKSVCSTAFIFTVGFSLLIFVTMILFREVLADFFMGSSEYANVIYITAMATLIGATNSIISAPTRMQNKRKIYLITNAISPILAYSISIPMLLKGYYLVALPLAGVVSGAVMELSFGIMNRKWFKFERFDFKILKQLLWIGVPLLPNFLIYWVFNSSDKVMITNLLGIGAAGIYSVAAKLGHCSQLIYTAFAGGWQYFAFTTMKEEKQVKSNSLVFEYLGVISYIVTMFVCVISKTIFEICFTEEYWEGYVVSPYLFLAPLLQMLYQVAVNQFLIIKKTWPTMFFLSVGAVCNIIINYFSIPILGIEGAAIATLIGYIISNIICVVVLYKMKLICLGPRFLVATGILIFYIIIWRFFLHDKMVEDLIFTLVFSFVLIWLYHKEVIFIMSKIGTNERKK